jgi:hypothetical protein
MDDVEVINVIVLGHSFQPPCEFEHGAAGLLPDNIMANDLVAEIELDIVVLDFNEIVLYQRIIARSDSVVAVAPAEQFDVLNMDGAVADDAAA